MRFSSSLILALSAVAVAEDQIPLADRVTGWFNKVQEFVSSNIELPQVPSSNPINAGASKVAEAVVTPIHRENWKQVLKPDMSSQKDGPTPWMVYITGGNTLLSPIPSRPNFALLDCEQDPILCNAWAVGPPAIYYFLLSKPLPDQSKAATTAHYLQLNRTHITPLEIQNLHTKGYYKAAEEYTGVFNPFTGIIAQFGLDIPIGYVLWGFSKMPSWAPMALFPFFSRSFMNKRMPQARPAGAAPAAAAR